MKVLGMGFFIVKNLSVLRGSIIIDLLTSIQNSQLDSLKTQKTNVIML